MATQGICSVEGCDKPSRKGRQRLCSMHEARVRRGGSPERRVEKMTLPEILGGETTFGLWTVLAEGQPYIRPDNGEKMRTALCRCECGVLRAVAVHTLKRGSSRHCGCRVSQIVSELKTTHGMSASSEHKSWSHLKDRCLNPNCGDFPDYGGRGITVCEEWRDSFAAFYAHMGPKPSPGHSIDRIDVDGNYEPGNCRWADAITQRHNRRR